MSFGLVAFLPARVGSSDPNQPIRLVRGDGARLPDLPIPRVGDPAIGNETTSVAISPDGTYLSFGTWGRMHVVDLRAAQYIGFVAPGSNPNQHSYANGSQFILVGGSVISPVTVTLMAAVTPSAGSISLSAGHPTLPRAAFILTSAPFFEVRDLSRPGYPLVPGTPTFANSLGDEYLQFSADGSRLLLSAGAPGEQRPRVYLTDTWTELPALPGFTPGDGVFGNAVLSPNGRFVALAESWSPFLRIWDLNTNTVVKTGSTLLGTSFFPDQMAFTADNNLVLGGRDLFDPVLIRTTDFSEEFIPTGIRQIQRIAASSSALLYRVSGTTLDENEAPASYPVSAVGRRYATHTVSDPATGAYNLYTLSDDPVTIVAHDPSGTFAPMFERDVTPTRT